MTVGPNDHLTEAQQHVFGLLRMLRYDLFDWD
jgi:hypothetical protein